MGQTEFKYFPPFKNFCEFKRLSALSLNILKTFCAFPSIYFSLDRRHET